MRALRPALVACLVAAGCGRGGARPSPPTTGGPATTSVASTTTVGPPALTAAPIAGLGTSAFHAGLARAGFTTAPPTTRPGFVTTTSTRADATISTYGTGPADVVKVIAEADVKVAQAVLGEVATTVARGPDAKRAEAWIKAALRKGPISAAQPRALAATYGRQPFELLVGATTATLSIGRLTAAG